MNKILSFLTFSFLLVTLMATAQIPPQGFNYSAVARNPQGNPIADTTIGIQISILKTSAEGPVQYAENHFVNTDAFGLFNLVVGAGAVQQGSMAAIDWSNDNYYLKVGMDVGGGTNFLTMGTTRLLSVPYALHAKTAESVTGPSHYIGEIYGGGVVFHVFKDALGVEHGLVVALTDQSTGQIWSNVDSIIIGPAAQSYWNGLSNSTAIEAQDGQTSSAASLCLELTSGGYSDWYLPSIYELTTLWNNMYNVSKTLNSIPEATDVKHEWYWSSTEVVYNFEGWAYMFAVGSVNSGPKDFTNYVRAIRAF